MGLIDTIRGALGNAVSTIQEKNKILNKFSKKQLLELCRAKRIDVIRPFGLELTADSTQQTIVENLSLEEIREYAIKKGIIKKEEVKPIQDNTHTQEMAVQKTREKEMQKEKTIKRGRAKTEIESVFKEIKQIPIPPITNEKQLNDILYSHLKRTYPKTLQESHTTKGIPDIEINENTALELKLTLGSRYLLQSLGIAIQYSKKYKEIGLVVGNTGDISEPELRGILKDYQKQGIKTLVIPVKLKGKKSNKKKYLLIEK